MTWTRLSEAEWNAMTPEQRKATPQGRPCPWCEKIIEDEWMLHTFVRMTCPDCKAVHVLRPGSMHSIALKGKCSCGKHLALWQVTGNSELMGDCPHCGWEYMLKSGDRMSDEELQRRVRRAWLEEMKKRIVQLETLQDIPWDEAKEPVK
jgi:phage FluMu protein Com